MRVARGQSPYEMNVKLDLVSEEDQDGMEELNKAAPHKNGVTLFSRPFRLIDACEKTITQKTYLGLEKKKKRRRRRRSQLRQMSGS